MRPAPLSVSNNQRSWRPANPGLLPLLLTVLAPLPAAAHHSFAMFDDTKLVTLSGTVKEWQWTNPHSWLTLTVLESGKPVDYSLESRSIYILKMAGMKRESLIAGEKVSVTLQPLRSGEKGGSLMTVNAADGTPILKGRGPGNGAPGKSVSP